MLLQIDGWFGSGKSVLWTLLDGHPDVFCSPIHDYSFSAFLDQKDDLEWVTTRHTEILRKVLARTQYYKFERVFWDGYVTLDFSADDRLKIPVNFNFYSFDYQFIKALKELSDWKIERIIDTLYFSIFENSQESSKKKTSPKFFASMSNPLYVEHYKNFPFLFPNGKSIQVRRGVDSVLAVRSSRKPMPEDFKTKLFYSDPLYKRLEEGEVEKILSFYEQYDFLVEKHPDRFLAVNFDDLVVNTRSAMHSVCKFLKIDFTDNLLVASHGGKELICNGKKYIGEVLDNIDDLLTKEEQGLINERIDKYYSEKR